MKITYLSSATVIIEANGVRVLTDPWLTDGAFYGAWHHYPPIDLDGIDVGNIDYVYVSHIHQDHFDQKTFDKIPKNIPVLIHRFHRTFLRDRVKAYGFSVVELENGREFDIGNGSHIAIYAGDNCDPSICGHLFGCADNPDLRGSLQIDSMCVVSDGKEVVVNTNDACSEIGRSALQAIRTRYGKPDFALVGYSPASLYPHCMMNYSERQMEEGRRRAKLSGLNRGLKSLHYLQPRYFMPFAGTYILGGSLARKNVNIPNAELIEAVEFFCADDVVKLAGSKPVLLNHNETFNIQSGMASATFRKIDPEARMKYALEVASKSTLDYEKDPYPTLSDIEALVPACWERLSDKLKETPYKGSTVIYFDLPEDHFLRVHLDHRPPEVGLHGPTETETFARFKIDPRLLVRALRGPRHANWNNIEIGSHLDFDRNPDQYDAAMHILLNSFHA